MKPSLYAFASALFLLAAPSAFAANIVCALKNHADPQKYISVKIELGEKFEENYRAENGLDVGKDNYSFDIQVSRVDKKKNKISLDATFSENNHVQDEVSSASWNFDIKKARKGQPVIEEPLELEGKHLMDFVCYYNE